MRVEPLIPDAAPFFARPSSRDAASFGRALDAVAKTLEEAQTAEDAFASGAGTLHAAMYARARADVTLAVATAVTGKCAQAVNAVFGMQV